MVYKWLKLLSIVYQILTIEKSQAPIEKLYVHNISI